MGQEDQLQAAIDLIYEAVLDAKLWPKVLTTLADMMQIAHIGLCAMDRVAKSFESIVPRTDPAWDARYKQYWAFRNPLWTLAVKRPANEIYFLDDLLPREDFAATPLYNKWWHPAGYGLGNMAANLQVNDHASALIFVVNEPGGGPITPRQARIFQAALPHIDRAVRIHRELCIRDLDLDTAPDRLERTNLGVMLVDRSARVLFANEQARALLGSCGALRLKTGRLETANGSDALHKLVASCDWNAGASQGPGGEIAVYRGKRMPMRVTVTPLRARGTVAELPWLGLQLPVAMVTIGAPPEEKQAN